MSKAEISLGSCDLQLAKQRLKSLGISLSIVKDDSVLFESHDHGVRGLIDAILKWGSAMRGASVADSVIGRGAALLCLYSGVAEIYAVTLSKNALDALKENHTPFQYDLLVPRILNRSRTDICPFEKAVLGINDPQRAFEKLKDFKPQG